MIRTSHIFENPISGNGKDESSTKNVLIFLKLRKESIKIFELKPFMNDKI